MSSVGSTSLKSTYQVIVLGSDPNSLIAAISLRKKGKSVLVAQLEGPWGGVAAAEEIHPGFMTEGLVQDTTRLSDTVLKKLGLKVRFHDQAAHTTVLSKDGKRRFQVFADNKKTAASIASLNPKDGEGFLRFQDFVGKFRPLLRRLLESPSPDITDLGLCTALELLPAALRLRLSGKKQMMELLRIAPMCVADGVGENFTDELVRAYFAGKAVFGTNMGPWSPGSNANWLIQEAMSSPPLQGGAAYLSLALTEAAKAAGVKWMISNLGNIPKAYPQQHRRRLRAAEANC